MCRFPLLLTSYYCQSMQHHPLHKVFKIEIKQQINYLINTSLYSNIEFVENVTGCPIYYINMKKQYYDLDS